MDFLKEFINMYGMTILYSVITAIIGYVGFTVKKLVNTYVDDETKRYVVRTCVRAVEQIYKDLNGEEKLNKCIESVTLSLNDKGINFSSFEIKMLIEAAVKEMNIQMGTSESPASGDESSDADTSEQNQDIEKE